MIIEEYLNHTKWLKSKYGDRSIVLMQVGSFYEMYGLGDKSGDITGSHIVSVSRSCDLLVAKKAQTFNLLVDGETVNYQVFMAGFGLPQLSKYVRRLTSEQYTIAIYDQIEKMGVISRVIREVVSPGTYLEPDSQDLTNNIMCIVVRKEGQCPMSASVAVMDMVTGASWIEVVGQRSADSEVLLDCVDRVSEISAANEILLLSCDLPVLWLSKFSKTLGIVNRKLHIIGSDSDNCDTIQKIRVASKQVYQRDILVAVYERLTTESVAGIMRESEADLSALVLLLDFVKDHNPDLLEGLQAPEIKYETGILQMGTHSLSQLNILSNRSSKTRLSSVVELIDHTVTKQGSRMIRDRLYRPLCRAEEIKQRLELVEACRNNGFWKTIRKGLDGIGDLIRVHRLACTQKLGADTLSRFCEWINQSKRLMAVWDGEIKLTDTLDVKKALASLEIVIADKLNIANCRGVALPTYERLCKCPASTMMIFQSGVDAECDGIVKNLATIKEEFDASLKACNGALERAGEKKTKKSIAGGRQPFSLLEKEGPRISGTKRRLEIIVNGPKFVYCEDSASGSLKTSTELKVSNLVGSKSTFILTSPYLEDLRSRSKKYQLMLASKLSQIWLDIMKEISLQALNIRKIARFVANCDVVQSTCYCADNYAYSKPEIEVSEWSFVAAKKLRHPLIERLNTEEIYVPNDVCLGKDKTVMLLYGTNAVGKSSFIKSIGVNVCLAQAGFYVACESMTLSPYTALFSRILGNDDLFRGLSTFAVEMSELRTILGNATSNTLVIGDELCSGTETSSALSIFASSVELLHNAGSSAVFATHFHEISTYEEVKSLKRLAIKHMAVLYDEPSKSLVYDRKLRDGPGNNMYGLEVCKSLGLPPSLLERAHYFRNKSVSSSKHMFSLKGNRYNQNRMKSRCEMCGSEATEVHHLVHQSNAVDGKVEHYPIHHSANLVNVCEKCHLKFHGSGAQHRKSKTLDGKTAIVRM